MGVRPEIFLQDRRGEGNGLNLSRCLVPEGLPGVQLIDYHTSALLILYHILCDTLRGERGDSQFTERGPGRAKIVSHSR